MPKPTSKFALAIVLSFVAITGCSVTTQIKTMAKRMM